MAILFSVFEVGRISDCPVKLNVGTAECGVGLGKCRIDVDRSFEERLCRLEGFNPSKLSQQTQSLEKKHIRLAIDNGRHRACSNQRIRTFVERLDDISGKLVVECKHVRGCPTHLVSPDLIVLVGVEDGRCQQEGVASLFQHAVDEKARADSIEDTWWR